MTDIYENAFIHEFNRSYKYKWELIVNNNLYYVNYCGKFVEEDNVFVEHLLVMTDDGLIVYNDKQLLEQEYDEVVKLIQDYIEPYLFKVGIAPFWMFESLKKEGM